MGADGVGIVFVTLIKPKAYGLNAGPANLMVAGIDLGLVM
jgi:hypothetical protein